MARFLFLLLCLSMNLYAADQNATNKYSEHNFLKLRLTILIARKSPLLITFYYAAHGYHFDGIIHRPDGKTEKVSTEMLEYLKENLVMDFSPTAHKPHFSLKIKK